MKIFNQRTGPEVSRTLWSDKLSYKIKAFPFIFQHWVWDTLWIKFRVSLWKIFYPCGTVPSKCTYSYYEKCWTEKHIWKINYILLFFLFQNTSIRVSELGDRPWLGGFLLEFFQNEDFLEADCAVGGITRLKTDYAVGGRLRGWR